MREDYVRLGDIRSTGVAVCRANGGFRGAGGDGNGASVAVRGGSVAILEMIVALRGIGVEGDGTRVDGGGRVIGPRGGEAVKCPAAMADSFRT